MSEKEKAGLVARGIENLKEFLSSKKAKAFLIGLVSLVCGELLSLPPETQEKILYLVATYIGAQGVADFGKEKAKAEKAAPAEAEK